MGQPDLRDFSPEEQARYDAAYAKKGTLPPKRGRADHLAMDYGLLLERGVEGMLEILNEKLAAIDLCDGMQIEHYEYYLGCKIELEGLKDMCLSYADEARRLFVTAQTQAEKDEYKALYDVLLQVPLKPARTFREALQSIHTYTWSLYGLYSFGKPDIYLMPYYERDIKDGVLTPALAQELIDCFFLQSVPNMSAWAAEGMMLGGYDENGTSVETPLTWHFLKAIEDTHLPDPNVGFCVTEQTSDEILQYVARLIADGHCQPTVWNTDAVVRSMLQNGFDAKAANTFTLSTCVEVTPIGASGISITSPYINLLQIFLDTLEDCDDGIDFDGVFQAFASRFSRYCDEALLQENFWQLERGRNSHDPLRTSLLIHDCLECGLSHDSGGARYNHMEPNILGMQNVGESFNCLYRLVYEEQKVTLRELKAALKADFVGYEELRAYIVNKIPHFGTGDETATAIQKRVADTVMQTFHGRLTPRGATVVPGAFSYREHEIQGRVTPASPDGRRSGAPLNDGSCPVQGYDNKGPTVSIACTSSWHPVGFLGGTTVNVKLNRGVSTDKLIALIKGHMRTDCAQMQFNVVDTEELLRAQKNPEQYGDLLVRVGGYSDFFVKLPTSLQNEIISRTANDLG